MIAHASPQSRDTAARQPQPRIPVPHNAERETTADTALGSVERVLARPGAPLDTRVRREMEQRFAHDFGKVRVHADQHAARSADAVAAQAYTVGTDVVFGAGRYAPERPEGQRLIAHELAHVVQQQGISARGILQGKALAGAMSGARIGLAHSSAEREADRAALAVTAGKTARIEERVSVGTVQRSVGGSLMGTLVGAGLGFVAGAMLGGPIGAGIGAIIGGLAGLIAGGAGSEAGRKLTSEERREAHRVYGPSLDYDGVRIAVSRVMTFPSHARTPYETVYLPPDTIPDPDEIGDDLIGGTYFEELVHELCHVWQTQHGIGVTHKLFSAIRGTYTYGEEKGLRKARASGKHFVDFGLEQQGRICSDYYALLRDGEDTTEYEPFIAELRQGGRRLPQALVPDSAPGDFSTPSTEESVA